MSIISSICGTKKEKKNRAYVQYYVNEKRKRMFFPKTTEAMEFKRQFLRNIKNGAYRESYYDVTLKTMI
jgi:hypothetical protein